MAQVTVRGEIDVPVERLWKVVADFGRVGWIPGGDTARVEGDGPGMVRIFGVDKAEIRERLESRDEATKTIVYSIPQGMPMPITGYRATMTVRPSAGGNSELEWSCIFEPDGVPEADARAQLEGLYGMMIGWIRDHLKQS